MSRWHLIGLLLLAYVVGAFWPAPVAAVRSKLGF